MIFEQKFVFSLIVPSFLSLKFQRDMPRLRIFSFFLSIIVTHLGFLTVYIFFLLYWAAGGLRL